MFHAPNRLVSSASRTWARSASTACCQVSYRMAALFTSTSSRPKSAVTRARARSMLSGSVTSSWQGSTVRVPAPSAATARSPLPASRDPSTTVTPRSASCRHTSRPIPRFAPVTSATGGVQRLSGLPVRPHGQLVPARIAEMKPAAARERVRLSDDLPARLLDLRFDRLELSGVDHHQRISGPDGRVLCEAAAQAAILEARVVRSVILKLPAEDLLVELLGPAHVGRAEFDVIDPPVMIGLRHRASFSVERDVPGECRLGHVVSLSCVESHNSWLEGDNLRVRRLHVEDPGDRIELVLGPLLLEPHAPRDPAVVFVEPQKYRAVMARAVLFVRHAVHVVSRLLACRVTLAQVWVGHAITP